MNDLSKKNKIIFGFIILSIISFLVFIFLIIFQKDSPQLNLFFNKFEDLFGDFFNVLMYISKRNPYNNLLNGLGEKAYLPISYLILFPFAKIGGYARFNILSDCYTNIGIFLACIFTLLSVILFIVSCNKLCKKYEVNKIILIPIYLSGIFMYTIERGNIILISISLLMLFLCYYNSDNKYKRVFAAFCLALTTCLKFYPVVFGFLYLRDKKYKDAFIAAFFAIIIAFLPFLFFKGGFNNISLLFRNMGYNSKIYTAVNIYSGLSIRNLINFFFRGYLKLDSKLVLTLGNIGFYSLAGLSIITTLLAFYTKKRFNIITALFFLTIFLQSNSRFYCILYIIPVYILIFKEMHNNNYKIWLLPLLYFFIILNPIRILYNAPTMVIALNEYLTVFLTIIFFVVFMVNIIITSYRKRRGLAHE